MQDIQKNSENRGIELSGVGISSYRRPILIKETNLSTVASFNFSTSLAADIRGTHMSRLTKILEKITEWDLAIQNKLAEHACNVLETKNSSLETSFEYFYPTAAPVTGEKSLLPANVTVKTNNNNQHYIKLEILATTLCPCSQTISKYGAHNQRARLTVHAKFNGHIIPIIKMLEQQASAPLYGVLKREDEKFVTEQAWENGKLVEDVVRDIVLGSRTLTNFDLKYAKALNEESIHAHDAWACYGQPIF